MEPTAEIWAYTAAALHACSVEHIMKSKGLVGTDWIMMCQWEWFQGEEKQLLPLISMMILALSRLQWNRNHRGKSFLHSWLLKLPWHHVHITFNRYIIRCSASIMFDFFFFFIALCFNIVIYDRSTGMTKSKMPIRSPFWWFHNFFQLQCCVVC